MAIISTSDYKTWRGISVSTYDTLIGILIGAAQAQAERWCGRLFDSATHTEKYSGSGTEILVLRNAPVASVTSITLTRPTGDSYTVDSSTYAVDLESGVVKFDPAATYRVTTDWWGEREPQADWSPQPAFSLGHYNVTVVYVGGYTSQTMPNDLKLAMYQYVDELVARSPGLTALGGSGPSQYQSESLGDYSYTRPASGEIITSQYGALVSQQFAKFRGLFAPYRRTL